MRKISLISCTTFLLLMLSACGTQQTIQAPIYDNLTPKVSILSDGALNAATKAIGIIFFEKLDTNKDGKVNFNEFKRMQIGEIELKFKKLDLNKDGQVTTEEMLMNRTEFLPWVYNSEALRYFGKSAFDTLDTDKNSILNVEEFIKLGVGKTNAPGEPPKPVAPQTVELFTTIFNSLDLNYDNILSLDEFEDFVFAQMKANAVIHNPLD